VEVGEISSCYSGVFTGQGENGGVKVAIIHNQFCRGGGMEAYMFALIKGFLVNGDRVSIHTYEADRDLLKKTPCSVHKVHLPPVPGRWRKYLFLRKCNREFRAEEYDLSLSLTRTCCQDIAVCGGVHPEAVQRTRRTSLFRRLHDRFEIGFEKKMLETTPWIMAHSLIIAEELKRHYRFDYSRIVTLYPPIDTDIFFRLPRQDVDAAVEKYGINKDKTTFLFPSCGHVRKGFEPLARAFAQLDPSRFELLVAGGALPGKQPAHIRYVGYVDNLAPLYCAVDFTILPSHYEPFGLVIPESLQCGTPVVTTDGVGAAALLDPADGIVMQDNSAQTIRETLIGLDKKQFSVTPDFAASHRLTVAQHIEDIKALAINHSAAFRS
jgi:glycosyltransferase involved in cell wall biosynthesis